MSQQVFDTFVSGEAIGRYCEDLTAQALERTPILGRDEEIDKVIEILQRRSKNNPVILGEAGVGKTAVVEGLAQRIAQGRVPAALKGRQLLSLNLRALTGGARWVGEFEGRMEHLLKDLAALDRPILFIDEMHGLMGLGKALGKVMDAANLLKPMLARGELVCIGASTLKEYKVVEADAALERRFQKVFIEEMGIAATVELLQMLAPHLARHHQVDISEDALEAAAHLSHRYIPQRRLPDKAIDLLDEACARVRTEQDAPPEQVANLQRRLSELLNQRRDMVQGRGSQALEERRTLDADIFTLELELSSLERAWAKERQVARAARKLSNAQEETKKALVRALRLQDLATAKRIERTTLPDLERQQEILKGEMATVRLTEPSVDKDEVARVVAERTGIPLTRMLQSERDKLKAMEATIATRVIGQRRAIQAVSNAIRRNRAGLSDPNRPVGSFLFLGPTGVGKTELAKALAEVLFDSSSALVRLDMSEFVEEHSAMRLIGVGGGPSSQGGLLTEPLLRRPYSIVLLDEVEKAHPDVFNLLLQVLDDGRLTDSEGRVVDCTHAVFVLTSNLGAGRIYELSDQPHEVIERAVMEEVGAHFRPEFINRIDALEIFHPLEKPQIAQIARLELGRIQTRLQAQEVELEITPAAIELLTELGYDRAYGARPLKRVLQRTVEDGLATMLIEGTLGPGSKVVGDVVDGSFQLTVASAP